MVQRHAVGIGIIVLALFLAVDGTTASETGEEDHANGEGHPADGAVNEDSGDGILGPDQRAGEAWSWTFDAAGDFVYHCHPHPWMAGHITILPSNSSDPQTHRVEIIEPEDPEAWAFSPAELTIRAGDTVVWNNTGQIMHKIAEMTDEHAGMHGGGGVTHDGDDGDHDALGPATVGHDDHDGPGLHLPSPTGAGGAVITGTLLGVLTSLVVIVSLHRSRV